MQLFELDSNYQLLINPTAYMLIPLKAVWDRDKTKDKEVAKKELAFIYFTIDYKSDFQNEPEPEQRETEVIKHVFGNSSKWKPDKIVKEAQEFYKERQKTFSLKLLEDALIGLTSLSKYMRNINFNETKVNKATGTVEPKHDIKKYADTIRQVPALHTAIEDLRKAVEKEQEVNNQLRGNREKAMYVDGD